MNKKVTILLLITLICTNFTMGNNYYKNGLGFGIKADLDSENFIGGISYQRWITDNIGLQGIIGGNYIQKPNIWQSPFDFCTDLELQIKLHEYTYNSKKNQNENFTSILYGWISCGYRTKLLQESQSLESEEGYSVYIKPYNAISPGLGFAVELNFSKNFSLPYSFGFVAHFEIGNSKPKSDFIHSISFRYRF